MEGLEFKLHPKYGLSMHATRDFEKGEVLFTEKPLLVAQTLTSKCDKAFTSTHDIDLKVFSIFKRFFDSSTEIQDTMLTNFYLPPTKQALDKVWSIIGTPCVDKVINVCKEHVQAWSNIDEEVFRKVYLVFTLNSNPVDSDGSPAIFMTSSKMNHSCDANTFYQSIGGSRAVYTATKNILKGDQVTTNYLEKDTILPTSERRKLLQRTKLLLCDCPRCMECIDISRGLPCPNCSMIDYSFGGNTIGGYIYWNPKSCNWSCDTCHSKFDNDSPRLHGLLVREHDLKQAVISLTEKLTNLQLVNRCQLLELYNACKSQLGIRHWTYILVLKMLILFDITQLSSGKSNLKSTLVQNLDYVLDWYEKGGFDAPRHLCMLILRVVNALICAEDYSNALHFLERVFREFPYARIFRQEYKEAVEMMKKCRSVLNGEVATTYTGEGKQMLGHDNFIVFVRILFADHDIDFLAKEVDLQVPLDSKQNFPNKPSLDHISSNPLIFLPHRHHLFPLSNPFTPRLNPPRNTHPYFPLPCELLLNSKHQLSQLQAILLASACARQQVGCSNSKINNIVDTLEVSTHQAMNSMVDSNGGEQPSTNIEITVTTAIPLEESVPGEFKENEASELPEIQNESEGRTTKDDNSYNILDGEKDQTNMKTEESELLSTSSLFDEHPLTKFDPFSRARPFLQLDDMYPAQPRILPMANCFFGPLFTVFASLLMLTAGIEYLVGIIRRKKVSSLHKSGSHPYIADSRNIKRFDECKADGHEEKKYDEYLEKDV
ncbi:5595_t:CDS:2 [Acaulospora morrowiae]|uniref:5595_t:CDS:1 n=1 Tax=Acaulospora morrowiae TaxID=94023 RepID=A0A9N9B757_9GLOM|nr:5595_t:CDS:2 [Acaulospora morrowiae]